MKLSDNLSKQSLKDMDGSTSRLAPALRARTIGLVVLLSFFTAGCSSESEQAQTFALKGNALLEKGEYVKAALEFRNAAQRQGEFVPAWYGLSKAEARLGNWEGSYTALLKVVEQDPTHLEALLGVGRLLLASGQIEKALDAVSMAKPSDQSRPEVNGFRSVALLKSGDKARALAKANEALRSEPTQPEALMTLAAERLAASDAKSALKYLERGVEKNTQNVPFQMMRVIALDRRGEFEVAQGVLGGLVERYPEDPGIREVLVRFYLKRNMVDDAEQVLRDVVLRKPADERRTLELIRFLYSVRGSEDAEVALKQFVQARPQDIQLRFALAELYTSNGNVDGAIGLYEGIAKDAGTIEHGTRAKVKLAELQHRTGNADSARNLIEQVLAADTEHIQSRLLRARMSLQDRDTAAAIDDLRKVLQHTPDSQSALVLLARAHELLNAPERTQYYFEEAIRAAPRSIEVILAYAQFLYRRGNFDRSEDILSDSLVNFPRNAAAQKMLAQVRIASEDWEGAQQLADEMKDSGHEEYVAEFVSGLALEGLQQYEQSTAAFLRAHEAAPTSLEPMKAVVRSYVRADKPEEAKDFLSSTLEADASNYNAQVLLATLYASEGLSDASESLLRRAIAARPAEPMAYRKLALHLVGLGRFNSAIDTLRQGLHSVEDKLALRLTLARLYQAHTDFDQATKEYRQIVKDYPASDIAANNLASLLSEHRNDKESLEEALHLAERFRGSLIPQYMDTLGWIYHRTGDTEKANRLLKKAVAENPNRPIFRYHLGMSFVALRLQKEARQELMLGLKLAEQLRDSEKERIEHALTRLEQ